MTSFRPSSSRPALDQRRGHHTDLSHEHDAAMPEGIRTATSLPENKI
ncbi:hypothetical protein [Sphingomonas sp. LH128]|nr:hypothetical protein [Sphingomonas sp. LH128]